MKPAKSKEQLEANREPALVAADWFLCLLLLMASLVPVLEWRLVNINTLADDAYTSLVYARNLAEGRGFVFRPDLDTLGTTTPLWVMIVAAVSRVLGGVDVRVIAITLFTSCMIASNWMFLIFRRAFGLRIGEASLLGVMGMLATRYYLEAGEGPLFQLLMVVAAAQLLAGRHFICGLLIGLLFLTRGEGLLMLPVAGGFFLIKNPFTPREYNYWRTLVTQVVPLAAGLLVVSIPWSLFALFHFGHVLPNTLQAKLLQAWATWGSNRPTFISGLLFSLGKWNNNGLISSPLLLIIPFGTIAAGIWYMWAKNTRLALLAAWCSLYVLAYTAMSLPADYAWYRSIVIWFLSVTMGMGLAGLTYAFATRRREVTWVMMGLIYSTLMFADSTVRVLTYAVQYSGGDVRAQHYLAASAWLRQHAGPGESIACGEIGYLGFYTDLKIVDLYGLVDRDMLQLDMLDEKLSARRPDYYLNWQLQPCNIIRQQLQAKELNYKLVEMFKARDKQCSALYKLDMSLVSSVE